MDISVGELKNHLPEYLRRVQAASSEKGCTSTVGRSVLTEAGGGTTIRW